jgi:hypothetical protein
VAEVSGGLVDAASLDMRNSSLGFLITPERAERGILRQRDAAFKNGHLRHRRTPSPCIIGLVSIGVLASGPDQIRVKVVFARHHSPFAAAPTIR